MGTRCLTFVYDGDQPVVNLYRQFDGYPTGHGIELANFLNGFDGIVNGLPVGDTRKLANGMGCLAAQMISHFKVHAGGFYLYPPDERGYDQDYEYHVYKDYVLVNEFVMTDLKTPIFKGSWSGFKAWTMSKVAAEV